MAPLFDIVSLSKMPYEGSRTVVGAPSCMVINANKIHGTLGRIGLILSNLGNCFTLILVKLG